MRKIIEEVKEIQEAKELVRFSGYSIFHYVWGGHEHVGLLALRSPHNSGLVLIN